MAREKWSRSGTSHRKSSSRRKNKIKSPSEESETEETTEQTTDQSNHRHNRNKRDRSRDKYTRKVYTSDEYKQCKKKHRGKSKEKADTSEDDRHGRSKHRGKSKKEAETTDEDRHGRSKHRGKWKEKADTTDEDRHGRSKHRGKSKEKADTTDDDRHGRSKHRSKSKEKADTTDEDRHGRSKHRGKSKEKADTTDDDRHGRNKHRGKSKKEADTTEDDRRGRSKHRDKQSTDDDRCSRNTHRGKLKGKKSEERDYCDSDKRDDEGYDPSGRMIVISSPCILNQNYLVSMTSDTSEFPTLPPQREKKIPYHNHKRSRVLTPPVRQISKKNHSKQRSLSLSPTRHRPSKKKHSPERKEKSKLPCCPLCIKFFKCPVLLRCGHTFCKECVTVLVEASNGKSFKCPVCMTMMSLTGADEELFCPNFVVLRNIENNNISEECLCSGCDYENEADYFCENCTDLLCKNCKEAHKVVKYTKDHNIKKLSSNADVSKFIKKRYFCVEHENEQLAVHCINCDQSVCRECALLRHHGNQHKCISIHDAAKLSRDVMQRKLFNIKARTPNFQLALMDIKKVKKLLRDQVQVVRTEITESIKRLIFVLKEKERSLFHKVDQVYKTKMSRLNSQKDNIVIELEQFEVLSRVFQQLEQHDNNVEMLQMKATVEKSLDKLEKSSSLVKINKDTFLLKSNEMDIKTAIAKHGEIFRVDESSGNKSIRVDESSGSKSMIPFSTIDNKYTVPIKSEKKRTENEVIFFSDFEDNVVIDMKENIKSCLTHFIKSVSAKSKAKTLRTKANWLIVRSRVFDIIKYGRIHGRIKSRPKHPDQSKIFMNRVRRAKARKMKAKSNWYIVKSRLKDIAALKSPPKLALPRERKVAEVWYTMLKKSQLRKTMRKQAIHLRARANWLLVQSKLNDIVDYGRVVGILSFSPFQTKWPIFRRKRQSRTISKLKHYRAVTLRARANWFLVFSRLKDIVDYPKKKRTVSTKQTWGMYRKNLLSSREKATRNKIIAGELRAYANWMIVKTRIPDIILYGMYEQYNTTSNTKGTTSYPLQKHRSPHKRSHSLSPTKMYEEYASKSQSSHRNARSNSLSKDEQSRGSWDILISGCPSAKKRQGIAPLDKNKMSHNKKKVGFENETTLNNWDPPRLTRSRSADALNNWTKLISERHSSNKCSSRPTSRTSNGFQNRPPIRPPTRSSSSSILNKDELEKNWDKLIDGTTTGHHKNDTAKKHWDILISGTSTSGPNHRNYKEEQNWDRLIAGTLTEYLPTDRLSKTALKNWDIFIAGTKIDPLKSGRINNEAKTNWDRLIVGTDCYNSKVEKSRNNLVFGAAKNGFKVGRREKDANCNWDILISGTSISSHGYKNPKNNWDILISGTSATDYKSNIPKNNWDTLITGTSAKKFGGNNSKKDWETLVFGTSAKQFGGDNPNNNWDTLITGTNCSNDKVQKCRDNLVSGAASRSKLGRTDKEAKQNWDTLIFGTATKPLENNNSKHNWGVLISGTSARDLGDNNPKKNWDTLVSGTSATNIEDHNPKINWDNLVSGTNCSNDKVQKNRDNLVSGAARSRTKAGRTDNNPKNDWDTLVSGTNCSNDRVQNNRDNLVFGAARSRTKAGRTDNNPKNNWDTLIFGTTTKSLEGNNPKNNWDTLVSGTNCSNDKVRKNRDNLVSGAARSPSKSGQTDNNPKNNWDTLIFGTSTNRLQTKSKMDPSKNNWDRLVAGTTESPPSRGRTKAIKNWNKIKVSLGRARRASSVRQIEKNWDQLVLKIPDSKKERDDDAINNWKILSTDTPSQSNKSVSAKDKAKAVKDWDSLISGSKIKHNSSNDRITKSKNKTFKNWKTLVAGTQGNDGGSKNNGENSTAFQNRNQLIFNNKKNETVQENWKNLIQGNKLYFILPN